MKITESNILNSFIKSPQLKISSERYPFNNFSFIKEKIDSSKFILSVNSVLGKQAESIFEYYIKNSENFKLLIANLQIYSSSSLKNSQDKKQTIGELDYIVRSLKTNKVIHIELACKFYLYDLSAGFLEEEKWIGPNRNDSLYDKLEKIKSKQFPLINRRETIQAISKSRIEFPTKQELCLKAFLFIPKGMDKNIFPKNYKKCIVGYWIKSTDFTNEDSEALFAIPNKKEWIIPYQQIQHWYNFKDIKTKIKKQIDNKRTVLIYKNISNQIEYLFVVWW